MVNTSRVQFNAKGHNGSERGSGPILETVEMGRRVELKPTWPSYWAPLCDGWRLDPDLSPPVDRACVTILFSALASRDAGRGGSSLGSSTGLHDALPPSDVYWIFSGLHGRPCLTTGEVD